MSHNYQLILNKDETLFKSLHQLCLKTTLSNDNNVSLQSIHWQVTLLKNAWRRH